jgi:hypothetical protein
VDFLNTTAGSLTDLLGGIGQIAGNVAASIGAVEAIFNQPAQQAPAPPVSVAPGVLPGSQSSSSSGALLLGGLALFLALK